MYLRVDIWMHSLNGSDEFVGVSGDRNSAVSNNTILLSRVTVSNNTVSGKVGGMLLLAG
jgi:hypothetical protein